MTGMIFKARILTQTAILQIQNPLLKWGIHLTLFIVLLFQFTSLKSQNFELEDLLADLPVVCEDVALNIGDLAKKYFEADQLDSLQLLAKYWEAYCGSTEPVIRLTNLVSIAMGTFNDSILRDTLMNYVVAYEDRVVISSSRNLSSIYSKLYMNQLGNVSLNDKYDQFTRDVADKLLLKLPFKSDEYLLCLLYSNSHTRFLQSINILPFSESSFGKLYNSKAKEVSRRRNRSENHVLRIWVPNYFQIEIETAERKPFHEFEFDAKMIKRTNDCLITSERLSDLFINYHRSGRKKDIGVLLNYWKNSCGLTEPIFRMEKLFEIENEELTDSSLNERFFEFAELFDQRINSNSKYSQDDLDYNSAQVFRKNNSITDEFDQELLNWAGELLEKQELGSYGYMISLIYSGEIDAFYSLLKENPGSYGTLSSYYDQAVMNTNDLWDISFSASFGGWFPSGNLAMVGSSPTAGLHLGLGNDLQRLDFSFEITVANQSKNEYDIFHQGQLQSTNYFSYMFAGLEHSNALVHSSSGQIQLLSGVGYAEYTTLLGNSENEIPPKKLYSFNLNCGIGFQLFTENGGFAALQFRYNLTYLNNKGGTDLGGDFLSARLLVSVTKTKSRWERRKALRQDGV